MNTKNRQKIITQTSILNIIIHIFVATFKISIGLAASSIAIVSEGVNNAMDMISSVITLIGTKLSAKHPDEKHPFGYGRIEYISTMILGIVIVYAGVELAKESIQSILHPSPMHVNMLSIAVVATSAVIKFFLGNHTMRMGKQAGSTALSTLGKECRNDFYFSTITILTSILYMKAGLSVDGLAGLIFSFVIIKNGFESLMESASDIIGRFGEEELAKNLYREVRKTKGIIHAVDLMLHSYGPDHYSGSMNIEVDHKKSIGEIYEIIHDLQLHIMEEYHVTMVFGIYAVDTDCPLLKEMRQHIASFIKSHEHVKNFHALYLSPTTHKIYCDIIVDYELRDWDQLSEEFTTYMGENYPENPLELVIETEYV